MNLYIWVFYLDIRVILTYTQKSLANQGRKALFSLYSKLQDDCFNFETMLSLFDTYVASILNYSCEVWGNHKCDDIELVQMKFYIKGESIYC